MKRTILLFATMACMAITSVSAQKNVTDKIIKTGQTDNLVMHHLDVLTNRFGGRPIGSDAYDNATKWVASKFKEWGLQVELQEAGTLSVGFNRGPWFGRLLGDNAMELHFVTPSYTSGTKGLQQGHVLVEPLTQKEFDRMKGRMKGAWVLVNGNNAGWPVSCTANADSLRLKTIAENNETAKENDEIIEDNWTNHKKTPLHPLNEEIPALFYKEMCEAGVLGFIQSAEVPLRALYDKSVVFDPDMTIEKLPTTPDIKLDKQQFATIKQMVKERRSFQLEFDIRNHFRMGPVTYYNVIGSIEGTQFPDEYVMLSGHLDSYDVATGGVDCGSGVTPVIEAARMIAKAGAKPKRTLLFCAFAGEEFGLLGATAWVKGHPEKLAKISNLFNRDGAPTPPVGIHVPKAMYNDFVTVCEPIKRINPEFPFEVKEVAPRKQPTQPGGTDASVFAVAGVPTFNFVERDIKGYNFSYDEIWHTERDLYTKSIPEYQEQAATVMAVVALGVANLDHQLSREGLYLNKE